MSQPADFPEIKKKKIYGPIPIHFFDYSNVPFQGEDISRLLSSHCTQKPVCPLLLEFLISPYYVSTNNRSRAEKVCVCQSVCESVYSSDTDVIAGSSPISLEGNSIIIPTPGHNGLFKQRWTE